jgi:hypothetical protein
MKAQRREKEASWVGQKGDLKPKTKAPFLEPDLYDYEGIWIYLLIYICVMYI